MMVYKRGTFIVVQPGVTNEQLLNHLLTFDRKLKRHIEPEYEALLNAPE
jgi:hypothetical protein